MHNIVLIISTSRRFEYLKKTLKSLFDKNPGIEKSFKKVWVLDDRSTTEERYGMEILLKNYFNDNFNTITFNSNEPFYYVEKFNMVRNLVKKDDIVFFLEDDWECVDSINLDFHVNNLLNSNWTQIAFADPLWVQDDDIKEECDINDFYWKNPYPKQIKHAIRWDGGICHWVSVSINNWTNNPGISKGEVYHKGEFSKSSRWEFDFADSVNGNQVWTKNEIFRHFGDNSAFSI